MELRPRVIKGFSDYVIYPDGRVYSCKIHQILKPTLNKVGYYQIGITNNNGERKKKSVHRLVAEHFVDNPQNKPCVDHIDRNKINNNMSNLRWVTHSENCQNKGMFKTNTTGIKNVDKTKDFNVWRYLKRINNVRYDYTNKNKQLVLWYKFVFEILH
tara:strand:- start:111 stop:581 length:471 start_codon:yes stop_codon:yes gene_type:complete